MTRLLDAGWLLNAIEKLKVRNTSNNATIFDVLGVLDDVEKIIKAAPINDPVKHGHWIKGCPTETTDYFNCSVCNAGIFVNNLWRVSYEDVSEIHRFCHNCGAKMDGDTGGDKRG